VPLPGTSHDRSLVGSGPRAACPGARGGEADAGAGVVIRMTKAHTSGPWEARGIVIHRATPDSDTGATPLLCVVTGEGTSSDEDEANAEFIVRACNSHDALLEVAKKARAALVIAIPWAIREPGETNPIVVALDAAISKAEGP